MSVLIKGMEMPTRCGDCKMFWSCELVKTRRSTGERANGCPLIKLPNDDEFAKEMKIASEQYDEEQSHIAMDGVMCDLLKKLGYEKAIEIFEDATKWYA